MAGLQIVVQPLVEPVTLADMKNYMKVTYNDDDTLIQSLITTAREMVEGFTARSLVNKGYVQSLDAFPYFTDTVMSQMAFPPSYYSLPRYSTTLWNYSQMIKLMVSPLVSVSKIAFLSAADSQWHSLQPADDPWFPNRAYALNQQVVDGNGNLVKALNPGTSGFNPPTTWAPLVGGTTLDNDITWQNIGPSILNEVATGVNTNTFFPDNISEPPRIFPGPAGSFWPPVKYVPAAVQIFFTAGYGDAISSGSPITLLPPTGIPGRCISAIKQLVAGWYEYRESIAPIKGVDLVMPYHLQALLWSIRVLDFQPTRG
jgi:hypothetical protein